MSHDDPDDALFAAAAAALPSDTEVALQCLWRECPAGARVAAGSIAAALRSQVYGIVRDRTAVDRELERLRLGGRVRVLQLPAARDEAILVDADRYHEAACAALDASVAGGSGRAALRERPTALTVDREALGQEALDALTARGFCLPTAPARTGPDEAPPEQEWLWSVPGCGALWTGLVAVRRDVLRTLGRHRLGGAQRVVVERGVASRLRESRLDMRFVLRDCVGRELLTMDERLTNLGLTAAGRAAAASLAAASKRKR